MKPISLSDKRLAIIKQAAKAMPQNTRDQFLQDVARHLTDTPSDDAVMEAINVTYDRVPVFMNDRANTEKGTTHDDKTS